jgi:histidine triad (HIT) family protein
LCVWQTPAKKFINKLEDTDIMPELTPEQVEQLKNLPPEKLAELQKQNCPFCMIVAGKIPAKRLYDDNECIAILDINPANPGHVLILPKEHYQIITQVPEETLAVMTRVSKALTNALFSSMDVQGSNILVQNGPAADQKAPHFLMHVIPRFENDGLNFGWQPKKLSEDDMEKIFSKLTEKPISIGTIKQKPIEEKEKEKVKEDSNLIRSFERIP